MHIVVKKMDWLQRQSGVQGDDFNEEPAGVLQASSYQNSSKPTNFNVRVALSVYSWRGAPIPLNRFVLRPRAPCPELQNMPWGCSPSCCIP